MSNKTHVVAVIGVMKKNGQMASHGQEVSKDDFDDFNEKIDEGYLLSKEDFAKLLEESGAKAAEPTDQEKADLKAKADQEKAAAKAKKDLLSSYKKAFTVDAPVDASDEDIQKAIADNVAIATA